ncbi:MAG: glycosyltransferase family 39 protein [Bacteroidota bacterium]
MSNKILKNSFQKENLLFFLIFSIYIFLQIRNINIDFWNDEVYTLQHFVFVPFQKIITDYHVPNNHVLFSIITKIYLKILGITSLNSLMDRPYLLRLLPLSFSIVTIICLYKTAKKIFNADVALLSVLMMTTCIPYFNFCLQIRGYMLSILLFVLLANHILNFIKSSKSFHLAYIVFISTLFIYTIPSNLYFVLTVLMILGAYWIGQSKVDQSANSTINKRNCIYLMMAIIAGTVVAIGLYIPMIRQVFFNEFVVGGTIHPRLKWKLISSVFIYFISGRYLFLLMMLVPIMMFKHFIKDQFIALTVLMLTAMCTLPFLISFLIGDDPPDRVFVILIPVFSVLMAVLVHRTLILLLQTETLNAKVMLVLFFYCLITFMNEQNKISNYLMDDLKNGRKSQDIHYSFYLHHYHPRDVIKEYIADGNRDKLLVIKDCEMHDFPVYLDKFNVHYFMPDKLDSILNASPNELFVVTRYPDLLMGFINKRQAGYTMDFDARKLSYNNMVRLTKQEDSAK